MALFKKKKEKTDLELIEEWTPKLREFADKHSVDVKKIELDRFRFGEDDTVLNVSIKLKTSE